MIVLPVIERELRMGARNWRTYVVRIAFAAFASSTVLGIASPALSGLQPSTALGAQLFRVLSIAGAACCLLSGAFATADVLSQERRNGGLELLALTKLRGWDLVRGKMVALSLNPAYCALSALPLLALPVIWGGVTLSEFWRMAAVWLSTLFLSLSVGLFVSSVSWYNFKAFTAALGVLLVFVAPVTGYGVYGAMARNFAGAPHRFWVPIGLAHLLAALFLTGAGWKVFNFQPWDQPEAERPGSVRKAWRFLNKRGDAAGENPVLWWEMRQLYRWVSVWSFLLLAGV